MASMGELLDEQVSNIVAAVHIEKVPYMSQISFPCSKKAVFIKKRQFPIVLNKQKKKIK
jgi:hypothetical protein